MGNLSPINMVDLKHGMAAKGLDVLVAVSPENFFCIADVLLLSQKIIPTRLCFAIVPRDGQPAAIVCHCEEK